MSGIVLCFSALLWWMDAFPEYPEIERNFDRKIESVRSTPENS
jgi:hypothetical protein